MEKELRENEPRKWKLLYALVVVSLAVTILLLYLFTEHYQ